VKAGIKNEQVINHLAATICRHDVATQLYFEQIFAHVRGYHTFLGPDKDPYRVAKGQHGPISANKAKVVTPDKNENEKSSGVLGVGIRGIVGMFASLLSAVFVQHIFQLMQSSVQTGKASLNQVQSGSILHSTRNLM
jgi:hypothetical protein